MEGCDKCGTCTHAQTDGHIQRIGNSNCFQGGMDTKHKFSNSQKVVSLQKGMEICLFVCVLASLFHSCTGFNLDTASKREYKGPNPNSYFGYSIGMLKSQTEKWILVGAPRDNSKYLPDVRRSGAIYKVTITDNVGSFNMGEVFIDDKNGSDSWTINGTNRVFIHGRDDQWLGASMDVQENRGIVTCASRWFNQYYLASEYLFMNGICYEIPLDFNSKNIVKLPALIDGAKQTETVGPEKVTKYNYGMGSLGAAVHYSQGPDLLMGAPGLQTWTGGFLDKRQKNVYITEYQHAPTEDSEMAGYAVSSGDYFKYGTVYFVIGAPRDGLTGKVYVFSSRKTSFMFENADLTLNGTDRDGSEPIPMNGFFGAALCSVDVNNDGYEDLLVGAPMYSDSSDSGFDEGVVFVYLGRELTKFEQMTEPLTGNKAAGGRFGTAIGSLGDINADTFNDVIVGAPYENEGQGAIYVYNGCKTGLWPHATQRIPAEMMAPGLKSFGISFSKPVDMNDDDVKDIAVGAYLSDSVYLLHGLPIINMQFDLTSLVDVVDKDTSFECLSKSRVKMMPCFMVRVCFRYNLRTVQQLDVDVMMVLDTYMGDYYRLEFEENSSSRMTYTERVFHDDPSCRSLRIIIRSTANLVTPIRIYTNYTDRAPSGQSLFPIVSQFNGDTPNKNLRSDSLTLDFKKDCPNNVCETDLTLTVDPIFKAYEDKYYVLGTNTNLTIDVQIKKTGHPSYGSNIFVTFNKNIHFQKLLKVFGDTEIPCAFVEGDHLKLLNKDDDSQLPQYNLQIPPRAEDENMMVCSFGNPLLNNTGVRFKLVMTVSDRITNNELTIKFNTTTLSNELTPADNVASATIPIRNKVSTTFSGVSLPSFVTMRDQQHKYTASHVYELRNLGPSLLPKAKMTVQYPQVISGGVQHIRLSQTKWSCREPCKVTCNFPDEVEFSATVRGHDSGPTYYLEESKEEGGGTLSDKNSFDCTKESCPRYECDLTNIPPREGAVVKLEFLVQSSILNVADSQRTKDGAAIKIRSDAYIRFGESDRLISEYESHFTDIQTDIQPERPPRKPLAWWIILVSIVGGLLLIVIVVLILWKCGFFKRKQREEMMKWQHSGEVETMLDPDEPNGLKE